MRKFSLFTLIFSLYFLKVDAQSTYWGVTGNSIAATNFIGSTNNEDLIFKAKNLERGRIVAAGGYFRFGSATNYAKFDSTGKLSFTGTGGLYIAANEYVFQSPTVAGIGLYYNSTNTRYEFRNSSSTPIWFVNYGNGNGYYSGELGIGNTAPAYNLDVTGTGHFTGMVKIGAYTLPCTDGTSGQVMKTNGAGVLTWSADNNTTYTAGTGITIASGVITNSEPDKTIVMTNGTGISVTGTYPNFTVTNTEPDKTVSLTGTGGTSVTGTYPIFTVSSTAPTTYTAGTGISIASGIITNSEPDKTVTMANGTGISVTGTYPNFTVTNTEPNQTVSLTGTGGTSVSGVYPNYTVSSTAPTNYTAGTGISITGGVIANTEPDQTVSLTGTGGTTVSGTYPNYTIGSTAPTTYNSGSGITIRNDSIINSLPNQTVSLTGTGGTTVSGTYPNFTVGSTTPTTYNAGNGISIRNDSIINSSPDKTVSITGTGGTTVSGAYPNFTVGSTTPTTYNAGSGISIRNDSIINTGASQWTTTGNNIYDNNSGNVGIGTSSPTQKLQVAGTTETTNLQMTNGASNGYIMQSDANGNASWANPISMSTGSNSNTNGVVVSTGYGYSTINISGISGVINPGTNISLIVNLTSSTPFNTDFQSLTLVSPSRDSMLLVVPLALTGTQLTNTTFSTSGTSFIYFGIAPYSGTYVINSSNLNGSTINGTWRLSAEESGGGTFTITNWSLTIANPNSLWAELGNSIENNNSGSLELGQPSADSVEKVDLGGNIAMEDNNIYFRGNNGTDHNNGLGFYGNGSINGLWNGYNVNGPVLYGNSGGVLGASNNGQKTCLTWLANGNVGIGTTAPAQKLQVTGTTETTTLKADDSTKTAYFEMTHGATNGYILQSDANGDASWVAPTVPTTYTAGTGISITGGIIANTEPNQTVSLTGTGGTTVSGTYPNFTIGSTTPTTYTAGNGISISHDSIISRWTTTGSSIYNNNAGNVGIGTTSPSQLLDVENTTTDCRVNFGAPIGDEAVIRYSTYSSGTPLARWEVGKSDVAETGGNSGSDLFVNRYSDAGTYLSQPFVIQRSTGNVGIGTTNPGQTLQVAGTTETTKLQMTNGAVNGYIMQSDATGNATWVTPTVPTTYTAGTGISITGGVIANTSPNQTVSLTGTGGTTVSGTYPNFTINSTIGTNPWTTSGNNISNNNSGNVGIGTATTEFNLTVNGGMNIDEAGTNSGTITSNALHFGNSSGEGIGSRRTSGANQYGLDFYTSSTNRMSILNNGNVGIGSTAPSQLLDVESSSSNCRINSGAPSGSEATTMYSTNSSGSSLPRWELGKNENAETGSNQGSDFFINSYDDAGNFLNQPLFIKRNKGFIGIGTTSPDYPLEVENSIEGEFSYIATIGNNQNDNNDNCNTMLLIGGVNSWNSYNSSYLTFNRPDGTFIGHVTQESTNSVQYSTSSDERLKENIRPTAFGLSDLMKIQIKDYNYKDDKEKRCPQTGYLAQQLYTVFPNAVSKGGDNPKTNPWMVDYGRITPLIIKSVQELAQKSGDKDSIIAIQQQQLASQQTQINDILSQLQDLKKAQEECCLNTNAGNGSTSTTDMPSHSGEGQDGAGASLAQNVPNPFSQNTVIRCYLPQGTQNAYITIYTSGGVQLKSFPVNGWGVQEVTINGNSLSAGTYLYSLFINNNLVDTKKMALTK